MKNNSTQQEVLLMTASGFASGQYSEKEDTGHSLSHQPGIEKLKEACWNGLIKEIFPELFQVEEATVSLFLWQVREATQFVALEMSEFPTGVDKYWSIDPYRFMEVQKLN